MLNNLEQLSRSDLEKRKETNNRLIDKNRDYINKVLIGDYPLATVYTVVRLMSSENEIRIEENKNIIALLNANL